jgi:cathepsin L
VSAVKDQGHCGSCWAFASTAVIESHVAIASGLLFDLSPEQIAMCSPNPESCGGTGGCEGATAEVAFEYVTNSIGMLEEFQYPYLSYYGKDYDCSMPEGQAGVATINGYVQLPANNYTALMNAVATVGPIAVSVDASTFHSYVSGIFDGCNQVRDRVPCYLVGSRGLRGDAFLPYVLMFCSGFSNFHVFPNRSAGEP